MKKKEKIIITGISGQDASYLIDELKSQYEIIGLSRIKKKKIIVRNTYKIIHTDYSIIDLKKIIKKYKPIKIFNMAGQSNPSSSWILPSETIFSIVTITLNLLESIISINKKIKFFNCSTSEIFSKTKQKISEKTKLEPENPYACAKAFAHNLVQTYRKKYKIFAVNGILFNHESPRRNEKFLVKKLVMEGINVYKKKQKKIYLQSSFHIRDISHAKDIVKGIIKIMNSKFNEDFIIASGKSRSIKEISNIICRTLNIKFNCVVFLDKKLKKMSYKIANTNKIKNKLNWKPEYSFQDLIDEMIVNENNESK